jgi:6-phosphogluconolactonase
MKIPLGNVAAALVMLFGFAVATTTARAQGNFVYTNDDITGPNTVSGFSVASNGTLTPVPGSPFATGGTGTGVCCLSRPTIGNVGNFLFTSNTGSNNVSVFSINAGTGALSLVAGSPFATGGSGDPFGIALSPTPDGMFLMAANSGSNNLTVFSIAGSGALTPIAGSPFPTLSIPFGTKVSPDGKFLAVPERFGGSTGQVEMLSIATNGSLASLGAFPGVAFEETGADINCATSLLYSGGPNGPGTTVDAYSIASNGILTPIPGSPFIERTLLPPFSDNNVVLLSPNDKTLFVSNQFQNNITVFSVASNGSLTLVAGSPFPNPGAFLPSGLATSNDGSLLYVANGSNFISVFSVASTGTLTEVGGSPFSTGQSGRLLSLTAFPPKSCTVQTPTITSISPTSAIAGGAAFTLTVNGTNFVSGSTLSFNGNARATTFVSATQLTAAILALDIATAGSFNVTVTNPGGGTSNAVSFIVLTPQQATQAIINSVNALFSQGVINGGQDNSLVEQLQHAIAMMSAGKNNGAIGNLGSFIGEVNDLLSSGVLSPSQAASLISAADSVIAAL